MSGMFNSNQFPNQGNQFNSNQGNPFNSNQFNTNTSHPIIPSSQEYMYYYIIHILLAARRVAYVYTYI